MKFVSGSSQTLDEDVYEPLLRLNQISVATLTESQEDLLPVQLIRPATPPGTESARKSYSDESVDFSSLPLLHQRLGNLWDRKLHTDVVFLVGADKEPVEAHRIVLSSASHRLESLLYSESETSIPSSISGSKDTEKIVIQEPTFSPGAFASFIKALYTNDITKSLNLEESFQIFQLCKKYIVFFLEDKIKRHIVQTISARNVFQALRLSTNSIELIKLVPLCWKLIEEDTSAVLTENLETLDESTWSRVLSREALSLPEVELFQFLIRWGGTQCRKQGLKSTGRNKRQQIDKLLPLIRFSSMSSKEIQDVIIPSRMFDPKEIQMLSSTAPNPANSCLIHNGLNFNTKPRLRPKKCSKSVLALADVFDGNESGFFESEQDSLDSLHRSSKKLRMKKSSRSLTTTKKRSSKTLR